MWVRFGMLLALVLLMVGCAVPVTGSPSPAGEPQLFPTGSNPPRTAPVVPPGVSSTDLAADITTAQRVVDLFWTRHWSDTFTGEYVRPNIVGLYDGANPDPNVPTCAGVVLPPDNALYCPSGRFVAWDVGLMTAGSRIGDAWVYLIIAHEWGHAIQDQISATLNAQQSELQADCFAGAALFGAVADGTLKFEQGDTEEITRTLQAVADDTPWTSSEDHGNPAERITAFALGRNGGVRACLPINR